MQAGIGGTGGRKVGKQADCQPDRHALSIRQVLGILAVREVAKAANGIVVLAG
jgi:hypothetical protein